MLSFFISVSVNNKKIFGVKKMDISKNIISYSPEKNKTMPN